MQGDAGVLDFLMRGLRSELTAHNQYWLHYRILKDMGLNGLAARWRQEALEEMSHADRFVERIIFLGGAPDMRPSDGLRAGATPLEIIRNDLDLELGAVALYRDGARHSQQVGDIPSKNLFEALMGDEEGHVDFLETQLDLIGRIGEALYLQAHVDGFGEGGPGDLCGND